MKKVITLLLALSLVFALAACGGKSPDGHLPIPPPSNIQQDEGDDGRDSAKEPGQSAPDSGKGGILTEDGECTQKQMEDTIVSYLSKASDLPSLTLCGGSSIDYTAAFVMSVDTWIINDPDMGWEELRDSIDAQLSPAGFTMEDEFVILGPAWTATAGDKEMSLQLYFEDEDENCFMITCMPELDEPFRFEE